MNTSAGENLKNKFLWLAIFAIAMAFVETAVVVYLREMYFPENIQQIFPPKIFHPRDVWIELGRELATITMLLSAAILTTQRSALRIFSAFVFAFGLWDLFYYVFLKLTINWPTHWLEWDILFLIPWAWLGPWICPALIALMFVIWALLVNFLPAHFHFTRATLSTFVVGSIIALITFLQPAFPILLHRDPKLLETFVPQHFWWPEFLLGYILMGIGLFLPFWSESNTIKKGE